MNIKREKNWIIIEGHGMFEMFTDIDVTESAPDGSWKIYTALALNARCSIEGEDDPDDDIILAIWHCNTMPSEDTPPDDIDFYRPDLH